jgi:hypothetical protein
MTFAEEEVAQWIEPCLMARFAMSMWLIGRGRESIEKLKVICHWWRLSAGRPKAVCVFAQVDGTSRGR